MKTILSTITLLALVMALALSQVAVAEPDEVVKGIFDALMAEGSDYSSTKAMYVEYFPDVVYEETLEDDGFTIAISGSEYMDGSWTFTRDGDALVVTFEDGDFNGLATMLSVLKAVATYYGMNDRLITPYVNGLTALGLESENYSASEDEATGATTIRINIAGPWDMKELDEMAFDEVSLGYYEPLAGESISMGGSVGKMMMIANGSADDLTLLVGEYGGLDELAYRSIVNIANTLRPTGWEEFAAGYTELADAEADGWSVKLNADMATVGEIIDDVPEDYSFALVRFGAGSGDGEEFEEEFEAPAPAEAPTVEAFADGYFSVITGLEAGTAGASLKTAAAAAEVCAFAESFELYNPDVEPMRANMLSAFETMGEDEQALFWENFEAVRALLDGCLEDYEANRAVFEDAGVAEAMDEVMYDPLNRLAWENLRDHTLTMGNAMNVG